VIDMSYNFDQIIDRRKTESIKWRLYGDDVLPLWVADMDFRAPDPVVQALHKRVDHGIFGYSLPPDRLREVIVARLKRLYGWEVPAEALVFVPGVVTGFNMASHATVAPGDGVLVQTPVYYPILDAPANAGGIRQEMQLTHTADGHYEIDFDAFEAAMTDRTRLFILCNPHNPVGRVFRRDELAHMAEICLHHDVTICSDEIHAELLLDGHQHTPIALLSPEIADRTITLLAPSKTFNIAGIGFSVAVVTNPELRQRFEAARQGLVPHVDLMGYTAALAAYEHGDPWLNACLGYLEENCDFLMNFVATRLPGIKMARPEGTYLAWLDCRDANISRNPQQFFLKQAKVALNDGAKFGRGGEGFVRLNFGCPRATLGEALERMARALSV